MLLISTNSKALSFLFRKYIDNVANRKIRARALTEAVVRRCSLKTVFLEISQNLQENTCARVSFLIKLQASTIASENENNNQLPFLDVLFNRNGTHLDTTVYRKDTHIDLYLHWDAFTPISWKRKSLRTLVNKAYLVCSNKELLQKELAYLRSGFSKKNRYPLWKVKQLMTEVEEKIKTKGSHPN